jgi:hypothetical protein
MRDAQLCRVLGKVRSSPAIARRNACNSTFVQRESSVWDNTQFGAITWLVLLELACYLKLAFAKLCHRQRRVILAAQA